jgi:DNA polymerase-4
LTAPSDSGVLIATTARRLFSGIETIDGIRLLGVGMSSLTDWAQQILFEAPETAGPQPAPAVPEATPARSWSPGQDVEHATHGPGWVWGAGLGRVTVRFETRASVGAGPVRTFRDDDPALTPRSA